MKFLIFGPILTTVQTWTCIYLKKYNLEKSGNNQGKVGEFHSINLVDTMLIHTHLLYNLPLCFLLLSYVDELLNNSSSRVYYVDKLLMLILVWINCQVAAAPYEGRL